MNVDTGSPDVSRKSHNIFLLSIISNYHKKSEYSTIECFKYFFICILAIWISFFEKCLFMSFIHFSITWFVFLVLRFMSSFYILDVNLLSVTMGFHVTFLNVFFFFLQYRRNQQIKHLSIPHVNYTSSHTS